LALAVVTAGSAAGASIPFSEEISELKRSLAHDEASPTKFLTKEDWDDHHDPKSDRREAD
jgi:hypothetical protein